MKTFLILSVLLVGPAVADPLVVLSHDKEPRRQQQAVSVPEPHGLASAALLALGVVGIWYSRRRS